MAIRRLPSHLDILYAGLHDSCRARSGTKIVGATILTERDIKMATKMTTEETMARWTKDWGLINCGVVCVVCKQSQPMTNADDVFKHDVASDANGRVGAYPWVELHDAMDFERG